MRKFFITAISFFVVAVALAPFSGCNSSQKCEHEYVEHISPATCIYDGYRKVICRLCGTIAEQEIFPATGHKVSDEWKIDRPATCAVPGKEYRYCEVCKDIIEWRQFFAEGHTFRTIMDRKATCTSGGHFFGSCSCGEVRNDIFTLDLGGHTDENGDMLCDACNEELYSIPVTIITEGNATATAENFVLIGKQTGGIVRVHPGENSMVRSVHTLFSWQEDDPSFVGGNVVINDIPYLSPVEFENFATDYHYQVTESFTFGVPQKVFVTIADMNDTALAIVHTVYLDDNDNVEQFGPQVFLDWGVQSNENGSQVSKITVDAPFGDSLSHRFSGLYTESGEFISDLPSIELSLTKPVTEIYAVYRPLPL